MKLQNRFEKEISTLREFVKDQFSRQEQQLRNFETERRATARKNDEHVKGLNATIKELKENRERLENQVELLKIELETLTRFDKRKEAMLDIESTFDKLNGYIWEIDGKKKKTVTMLRKLQILMDADRGKLTTASIEIQTDESHIQSYSAGAIKFTHQSFVSDLINVTLIFGKP